MDMPEKLMGQSNGVQAGAAQEPGNLSASAATSQAAASASVPERESLDSLDDMEFMLEEIENKIAPLALA